MFALRISLLCVSMLLTTVSTSVGAATFELAGSIEIATGAFAILTPVGTPIEGAIAFDDTAVAAGHAGLADIGSIDINVGGFCFSNGIDSSACPNGGAFAPIAQIVEASVAFVDGLPTDTLLAFIISSPTWQVPFDVTYVDRVFTVEALPPMGTVIGSVPWVVPAPAALWLFAPVLIGLASLRRKVAGPANVDP